MIIVVGFVLVLVFCYMFYTRHRSRGTIALHRHPHDIRRRRSDPIELITTADILGIISDAQTKVFNLDELTGCKLVDSKSTEG